MEEKCETLNALISPFGYSYIASQDIFSSRIDAWQREFGYTAFYDKASSHVNMVLDCLPVYFPYRDRTWLIELWKGQYGVNAGCEAGVYYADRILDAHETDHALFQCVDDKDMLHFSLCLTHKDDCIAQLTARHWWLTAFIPGRFCQPSDLCLHVSVTLLSPKMADAFVHSLSKSGCAVGNICRRGCVVSFTFSGAVPDCHLFCRIRIRIVQCMNRLSCKLFLLVTRPFKLSADRVLCLYYYLPPFFRRLFKKAGR